MTTQPLELIVAGLGLLGLFIMALVGIVRPDAIYHVRYRWAKYWSQQIKGNADQLDQKLSPDIRRKMLISIRINAAFGILLITVMIVLMVLSPGNP